MWKGNFTCELIILTWGWPFSHMNKISTFYTVHMSYINLYVVDSLHTWIRKSTSDESHVKSEKKNHVKCNISHAHFFHVEIVDADFMYGCGLHM